MVVIIEGNDGVGKSTICKQICKQTDFIYVKESYTDDEQIKKFRIQELLARILSNKNYIYDRTTLIDDFVYQFLNKKPSPLPQYIDIIISLLYYCKIYHLTYNEQIVKKRLQERGDQYITSDMYQKISDEYDKFYTNLEYVHYFELTGNLEEDTKKLIRRIEND